MTSAAKPKLSLAEEIRQEALREMNASELEFNIPSIAPAAESEYAPSKQSGLSQTELAKQDPASFESYNVHASQRIDRILSLLKSAEEPVVTPEVSRFIPPSEPAKPQTTKVEEYKPAIFDEVKAKLSAQQHDLEEKTKLIQALQSEIIELKDAKSVQADEYKKTLKTRLSAQRKEFENVVKRHLGFIDTLMAEKNELAKKCESVSEEMKTMERSFKEKIKLQEDQNIKEIKQQRELWQASEKIKREKWIAEKTKIIKDQTVKGLEPEIQRMIAQHKIQLRQVEEKFKEDLIREKRHVMDSSQQQLEQLREKMIAERQKACEEEREFARQRYQKQLERDEMEFQQQKRKLAAEHDQKTHYLTEEFRQTRTSDQMEHKKAMDQLRLSIEKERADAASTMESVLRKHAHDLQNAREQMQIEKEQWQDRVLAKQDAEVRAWEERDEELEIIVQRLECETNSSSGDIHKRYQLQIEKLKSDIADETKQLQEKHNIALDKVLEAQGQLQAVEEQKRELQKKLLHAQHESMSKDSLLTQQKAELHRLNQSEQELSIAIKREFENKIKEQMGQIEQLKTEAYEQRGQLNMIQKKHQTELKQAFEEKEQALMALETRISAALFQKDEQIKGLKSKIEELAEQNAQLKRFIEKECKNLL
ncbi:Centrosomal protein of 131 kDa [Rhizoclosmatium hyalinum]|nr:Centrosomal protein of 131 kDa [Rhizoclosmatium hyalinum]